MLCKAARPSGWGWGAWWGRPAPAPAPGFTLAAAHWPCWLAMKGVNLQHRQVLGRGFSSLTGDAAVGRVGDRRAHLPWAAASAAPPASCGDCAPPSHPGPVPWAAWASGFSLCLCSLLACPRAPLSPAGTAATQRLGGRQALHRGWGSATRESRSWHPGNFQTFGGFRTGNPFSTFSRFVPLNNSTLFHID